jgi:hypothetical protein
MTVFHKRKAQSTVPIRALRSRLEVAAAQGNEPDSPTLEKSNSASAASGTTCHDACLRIPLVQWQMKIDDAQSKLASFYPKIKKWQSASSPKTQDTRPSRTSQHAFPYADAVDPPGQPLSAA